MRKLLGIALLALVLAALALFLPTDGAAPEEAGQMRQEGRQQALFGIRSALLADSGNKTVAVLHLYLFPEDGEEGELRVFCSGLPIQKNMLLLSHASVPGISGDLGGKIASELSGCGFSSRIAGVEDALSSKNSVIISDAGALPSALAENGQKISGQNSRAVFVESLPGRLIGEDGAIVAGSRPHDFARVPFSPGKESVAASQAALQAIIPAGAQSQVFEAGEGNSTVALTVNSSIVFCRAVYLGANGSCRAADTYALERMQGRLYGPVTLLAGQSGNFEFSLVDGGEVGRNLSFRASVLEGKREVLATGLAGGKIMQGFASSFAIAIPHGGKYVLEVSDQFSRRHAAAYVEALGLEVRPVAQQGGRYEFFAAFGGKPISGLVDAWMDSGGKKQYYSSNGTLVVWASPSGGSHKMHFAYNGLESEYGFSSEGGGLAETYVRLGVPSLLFLLAVFLLLRAGRKTKYTITFPKVAQGARKQVAADFRQLVLAWEKADRGLGGFSLAASPEEIASALPSVLGWKKGAEISPYSVRQALRILSRQGIFAESEGMFAPQAFLGAFSAGELCALRLMHDLLLERGIPFRRARTIAGGSGMELHLFSGKGSVLSGTRKGRRIEVFESAPALSAFERTLNDPSEENARIRIAQANGKLVFATASRQGLEMLLP